MRVTLYSKPGCCLCDDLKALMQDLVDEFSIEMNECNIEEDADAFQRFRYLIPVLDFEAGPLLYPPHSEQAIRHACKQQRAAITNAP